MPQISTYKIHNGTTWVEYYFRTSAAAVGVDTTNQFVTANTKVNNVGFTLTVESGVAKANLTLTGANIANGVTGQQHNYIVNGDEIRDSLIDLDIGMGALKAVTDIALTTNNYSTTLDSVYQAKDADLTAIAGLSGTSGFLKKTAANTWSLDTNSYVVTSRTINGKALSSNVTLTGEDIATDTSGGSATIAADITALKAAAQGTVVTYAIETTSPSSDYANASFMTQNADLQIQFGAVGQPTKIRTTDGSDVKLKDLKVGDAIYIKESTHPGYPDRWVSAANIASVTFSILETTEVGWSAITNKPTTISGYSISDAKITTSGAAKTITLGSNTYTATSSNPTASWGSSVTVGTVGGVDLKFTMPASPSYQDTKNTVGNETSSNKLFIIGATATSSTSGSYAQSYANTNVYIGTDNCLYSNGQRVVTIVAGTTAPTNPKSGDIWIDTTSA